MKEDEFYIKNENVEDCYLTKNHNNIYLRKI